MVYCLRSFVCCGGGCGGCGGSCVTDNHCDVSRGSVSSATATIIDQKRQRNNSGNADIGDDNFGEQEGEQGEQGDQGDQQAKEENSQRNKKRKHGEVFDENEQDNDNNSDAKRGKLSILMS